VIAAPDHYHDVLALTMALTHVTDAVNTACRVIAIGEPNSGKSTILEAAELLAHQPMMTTAKLATVPSIKSHFANAEGGDATVIVDEISKLFGEGATRGGTSALYAMMVSGYKRRTAFIYDERQGATRKIPTFGVMFTAGIGRAAPDDFRSRSVVLFMKQATDRQLLSIRDMADPAIETDADHARQSLRSWARSVKDSVARDMNLVRKLHPKLQGRKAEVWGPLFSVALQAGGDWLERCALAFERLALGNEAPEVTPRDQVTLDYYVYATENKLDKVRSRELWRYCESLGRDIYAPYNSARGFGKGLAIPSLGGTSQWREGTEVIRGWDKREHILLIRQAERILARIEASKKTDLVELATIADENPYEDF
jgi:hypothetical protein